jgi:Fur family ferric uptake transcriptional regulator
MTKLPAASASTEKIRQQLKAVGLRSTTARLAVMQFLIDADQPLTHAEVAAALCPKGFDQATIYRNLTELTESALLTRVELGDHVWRFELRSAGETHSSDHPHFVCVDCGEVKCLPSVNINIKPEAGSRSPRIGKITEVLLRGHCQQCS